MSYNLLNFPTGNLPGRVDTLAHIIDYYRPNLFLMQELKTSAGLAQVATMMNSLGYGSFVAGTFEAQQSNNGGGNNPLQQNMVYDAHVFSLKSESVVTTGYRDINEFVLYINDPALEDGADTAFVYVYVTHLKSAEGADNVQARLEMVTSWSDHLATLPADAAVICAGDFNLYTNEEPAYTYLTDASHNPRIMDPLDWFGNWTGSGFAHKEYLTQSTRETVYYNDGAGGGMDDRFDFILLSETLMNGDSPLHYVPDSHRSLGNNGLCYNGSITDCDQDNEVPSAILQSLYFISDHLPQVLSLTFDGELDISSAQRPDLLKPFSTMVSETLTLIPGISEPIQVTLLDMEGRLIDQLTITGSTKIDCTSWPSGFYLLKAITDRGKQITYPLCVVK